MKTPSPVSLPDRARNIRRLALRMGEVQGQGYIGQALGMADILAVACGYARRSLARSFTIRRWARACRSSMPAALPTLRDRYGISTPSVAASIKAWL